MPRTSPPHVPSWHRGAVTQDLAGAPGTLAVLFASGATLALVSVLLPHSSRVDETGILVTLGIAYVIAAALVLVSEEVVARTLPALVACGTVLIGAAVYFGDADKSSYAFFYIWVSLYGTYFLDRRGAAVQVIVVAITYAAVLTAQDPAAATTERWMVVVGTVVVATVLIWHLKAQVQRLIESLATVARTDPLTGLMNRRGFQEQIESELERARRGGRSLTLICADLDHFKQVNDRLGHHAGDEVLVRVAAELTRTGRRIDVVARIGGEEFALLVPDTDADGARVLAERVREQVQRSFADDPVPLTVSLGIATFPQHAPTSDLLLRAADSALYVAKDRGRNRSVLHAAQPATASAGKSGRGELLGDDLVAGCPDTRLR